MFRCSVTGQVSKPGESPVFMITGKRLKEYWGLRYPDAKPSKFGKEPRVEKLGQGYEIVKEVKILRSTLEKMIESGKEVETR